MRLLYHSAPSTCVCIECCVATLLLCSHFMIFCISVMPPCMIHAMHLPDCVCSCEEVSARLKLQAAASGERNVSKMDSSPQKRGFFWDVQYRIGSESSHHECCKAVCLSLKFYFYHYYCYYFVYYFFLTYILVWLQKEE